MERRKRSILGDILMAPWSLLAWMMTIGWLVLLTLTALPLYAVRPFESFQLRWPHRQFSWPLWIMGAPLRVTVDPRYDRRRTALFVQNHASMLDGLVACGTIHVPLCGLENAAHLRVPGYGWLLTMSNAIPVRRGARRYEQIVQAFRERASRGISVLAFPEGSRTTDGKLRPFRTGAFRAAIAAGLPVVPVAVRGVYRVLPKGTAIHRPARIEAYIAAPIETQGLGEAELEALMDRVAEVIEAWVERGEMLGARCGEPLEPKSLARRSS